MPEVRKIDPSLVASETMRISVTPQLLERFRSYASAAAIGERQLAAVCLCLGFLALTISVPSGVGTLTFEEAMENMVASVKVS